MKWLLTGCCIIFVMMVVASPARAATTYGWSCMQGDGAETGFATKQGAESAAKAHRDAHPGHQTVIDTMTDADLGQRITDIKKKIPAENFMAGIAVSEPNDCGELLRDGVFDTRYVFGSSYAQQQLIDHMCSASYHNYAEASSDALSLGIPIDGLMVDLGFSSDHNSFETNYQTLCTHKEMYYEAKQSSTTLVRTANEKLAEAFVSCVNGQKFAAYAVPVDTKQFQIKVKYQPDAVHTHARVQSFSYDKHSISCGKLPRKISGEYIVNCTRSDDRNATQLVLNTDAGSQNFKIPAFVPDPPVVITSAIGDVVMSLLDDDKFAAQHQKQRWIPCDKIIPGNQKVPGTEWARLTNNADLPLCGNRYPRAFTTGATIGQVYEDQIKNHTHNIHDKQQEADGGHGFWGLGFASNGGPEGTYPTGNNIGGGDETRPKTVVLKFYIRVD